MKKVSILKRNLMRAAMTLLVMLPWAANAQTRECNPITTYPWTDNFDSYTGTTSGSTNNLPDCWHYINTCTHNNFKGYPVVYGDNYTTGHSGHNFLHFDSYSLSQYDPQPQYAILPEMSGLAGKHITLWAYGYLSSNGTCTFKIGTMSDPSDANTFAQMAEQTLTNGWQDYMFTVPETSNTYLAIMIDAPTDYNVQKRVGIDDIGIFGDFSQTGDNEYTIFTAAGWGLFCDAIEGGESFNGKTVKLGADITITRMAGSNDKPFSGTFDGQGHTLTLNYGSADNPIDAEFVAPFIYTTWSTSPIFRNLTIAGHIYSTYTCNNPEPHSVHTGTGGLIGHLQSTVTIEHCMSNVEITVTGEQYAGGFVGLCERTVSFNDCMSSAVIHSAGGNNSGFVGWSRDSGWNINFTGCVFNGKLLQINGQGNSNGGFIGWTGASKTVTITNCLYAPAALAEGETMADYNSATFARGWQEHCSETNSYYTTAFGSAQAKQTHSITAGDFVTVAYAGTATEYATSGITGYGTGIKYNDVLYAGSEESVALTISNTVPASFNFTGYSVTEGASLSGSGNNYTLTMPNTDVDVVITANCTIPPVSYIDENGVAQTCSLYYPLEGTETVLGTAGEETWYVAQPGTLNYSSTITLFGNTHIILCDGAAMNIGTSDSPVSGKGFYCNGVYDLSVYTQSGNTGALAIYSSQNPFDVKNLTLAGGNVNATSYSYVSCNNLTVCRSTLGISASSGTAIYALGDVTFSYVTATTNGSIICYNTNFAVDHSQLTVNATNGTAIQASGGNVTLSYVTANITSSSYDGFNCLNFAVDNSQLTVTAKYEAIEANGVITLGCTAATDFIKATRTDGYINYSYYGTVKIADGQTLYAGSNAYTGTLTDAERQAIGGQKLTNVAPPTFDYIGLDGTGATHAAVVIDADNMPTSLSGWYIVQGTVNYTSTIKLDGETHIILADNAVMNVTTTSTFGINGTLENGSLFVYGQSGQSGKLNVTSNSYAIIIVRHDITIAGGIVTAEAQYAIYTNYGDIIIRNGGKTTANANDVAIYAVVGDITITGCEVEATGSTGIFADNSSNNGGGNVTIQDATVTATTTSTGYTGAIRSYNGDITIDNSNVTATGTARYGIYAQNSGNILLNGGKITASGSGFGLICDPGNVTIEGGQVEITGGSFGVYASNITLGWTNATDYIYVSRYMDNEGDPITLTKTFIDEASNTYSGTIEIVSGNYSINGKTLYPEGVSIFRKDITGYTETGGWVLIASPIGTVNPEYVNHMCSNNFDLYRFNQAATLEWENWKAEGDEHFHFDLEPGRGYLYANSEDVTLIFSGIPYSGNGEVTLNLTEGAEFAGWNLVGNPFNETAYILDGRSFYTMNGEGSEIIAATDNSIAPMEGVFVIATEDDETMTFTTTEPQNGDGKGLVLNLSKGASTLRQAQGSATRGGVIDRAIVRFDGPSTSSGTGGTLPKFQMRSNSTKVYIPQDGNDYAVVRSEGMGEMPVNFKAEKNGTYTISVNPEGVAMAYLHLIDNMTGADVDLLAAKVPELVEGPT